MKTRMQIVIAALALVFALGAGLGWSQSGTASVQGMVTDTTGAAIAGAEVVLTNHATGVKLRTQSDETGNYSFPTAPPGLYTLDATLSVASAATTVTVDASGLSNLLETDSNDLGGVIGPRSVENLPLNGRNFLQLSLLSGAAVTPQGAAAGSTNQTGHPLLAINVAGNEPDYTLYVVDGIRTIGSRAGNTALNIDTGAIDQFEVHYGFFMPDTGTNPGIVDVVTKAGGNTMHGEVYEYLRTNQMEARNYFAIDTTTHLPVPPGKYHQNQFGFNVGGPILHNRLFYFTSYEGYRQNQQQLLTGQA